VVARCRSSLKLVDRYMPLDFRGGGQRWEAHEGCMTITVLQNNREGSMVITTTEVWVTSLHPQIHIYGPGQCAHSDFALGSRQLQLHAPLPLADCTITLCALRGYSVHYIPNIRSIDCNIPGLSGSDLPSSHTSLLQTFVFHYRRCIHGGFRQHHHHHYGHLGWSTVPSPSNTTRPRDGIGASLLIFLEGTAS
jgi:hypothetical protein